MNKNDKTDYLIKVGLVANTALFLIHFAFLVIFIQNQITLMAVVNLASVLLYLRCFDIIQKKKLQKYLTITYTEIIVHMLMATICLGWAFGFELYFFAMVPTYYFGIYTTDSVEQNRKRAFKLATVVFVLIILARVHVYYFRPLYQFGDFHAQLIFYMINAVISFVFLIFYLQKYTGIIIETEAALKQEADYDVLTEIYNRRKMQSILDEMYASIDDTEGGFTVSILDIDNFKCINDTFGHDSGDYVLKRLARMLTIFSENSENEMIIGRWGGEEFVIIQRYSQSMEESVKRLEHIRSRMMKHRFIHDNKTMNITVTIGMAEMKESITAERLLKKADENLYLGKIRGKNKIVV